MKYSEAIFGKPLLSLTYQDVEMFFQTEREETINLEFKSYPAQGNHKDKENVIKKSVCAMLNSEGGIIIWGAPIETRDSNGITKASGSLTPFNVGLDKDKLINILSSTILPMPVSIQAHFLYDINGNSIVVIEVVKSLERPHQIDNRYYVRLDGQTRVAPHYLIKALMQSQDFPIIRGHIRLKKISNDGNYIYLTFSKLLFNTSKFNNEKNLFMRIMIYPGQIFVNHKLIGSTYDQDFPILSHGRPMMSKFILKLTPTEAQNEIKIIFQFGGEKSPSKTSSYTYNIWGNIISGDVPDESIYIVEKRENKLPSDVSSKSDDEAIEDLLNF